MENNDMIQYDNIYDEIRETLLNSRSQAYSAVNFALVQAYWHIGRIIVEHEQDGQERAAYGKAVLQELSVRLTEEFGKGLTPLNAIDNQNIERSLHTTPASRPSGP